METGVGPCPCRQCKGAFAWSWYTVTEHLRNYGEWRENAEDTKSDSTADLNETEFLKSLYTKGRHKPLYDGASINLLQGISMLLHLYSTYPGTSQAFMTALLGMLGRYFLPSDNILPRTFAAAKSAIADLLLPIDKTEMCKNKCVLYNKERANLQSCPVCNEPRSSKYKYASLPVTPRLKRWWSIPYVAEAMQTHLPPVRSDTERMTDIQQSPAWAASMERMQDPRCMVFGLATDGVNPFSHLHVNYSMWPISLKPYNLPAEVRESFVWNLFFGLVPGPNAPEDMNLFMEKVVDEFEELNVGVSAYDAFRKETFILRGEILLTITDMPGGHKLYKTTYQNALTNSCWICEQPGESVKPYNNLVLYLGHEKFLPLDSPLRAKVAKPGEESEQPPRKKMKEELYAFGRAVDEMKERVSSGETTKAALQCMETATGKKGLEELHRLPYFDPVSRRPVEAMHLIEVLVKKIFGLITGYKDPIKTLEAERKLGRFTAELSHLLWSLDKDGKELADERCLQIQVPDDFGFRPKKIFKKLPYVKSYEWMKIGSCGILKFTLRGLLGRDQMASLCKFLDCVRDICLPDISAEEARELKGRIDVALAEMELYWPKRINSIMLHMMHHLADDIIIFGPVRNRWAFSPERFNSFLSLRVTKRDTPEANLMEIYLIYELTQQLALVGVIPEGAIVTDPGAQLKAVTAARRELDGRLETDDDVGDKEEETHNGESSVPGLAFLTSKLRRPEDTTLSPYEVDMISTATATATTNISTEATRFYSAKIHKPRQQLLSCALVDKEKSSVCSSYIGALSSSGNVMFGRVMYYVHVTLNTTSHAELAFVEWQPTPQFDEGLWRVDRRMACRQPSFVPCKLLPPPLVTAKASQNLLYFLDANESRMPTLL